jgi:hypothetical protein
MMLVVVNPKAPAETASFSSDLILAVSSRVAIRSIDSSPITKWRNGVNGARKARLIPLPRLAAASRYWGNVSQSHVIPRFSTSKGIASTLTRSHVAISCTPGLHGAIPTPQLPIITVVMPCHEEQVIRGSQQICAS